VQPWQPLTLLLWRGGAQRPWQRTFRCPLAASGAGGF
jgi:hypothetical protein